MKFKFENLNCKLKIPTNWQAGFTVIELLIYMGILSVILTVITQMFVSILDTHLESQATSSVEQDGRYILARLQYDILRAQSVAVPASLGASTSTLELIISGDTYTYALDTGNLTLTANSETNNLNSYDTNLSGLTFQRLGNSGGDDTITISFTLTSNTQTQSGAKSQLFLTTISLRPN